MALLDWFRGKEKKVVTKEQEILHNRVEAIKARMARSAELYAQDIAKSSAQQSCSPAVAKDPTRREPTTLIQWVLLPVPKELQAQGETLRQGNINALIHNTINHVANSFKGLQDWQASQVRDGSVVSFSCQAPPSVDPMAVKRFLDATWDNYCKEAARLLREMQRSKEKRA